MSPSYPLEFKYQSEVGVRRRAFRSLAASHEAWDHVDLDCIAPASFAHAHTLKPTCPPGAPVVRIYEFEIRNPPHGTPVSNSRDLHGVRNL
jgi:hypothetical protein